MNCFLHPEREAIGTCADCGKAVCPECKVSSSNRTYCNRCIETRLKTGFWPLELNAMAHTTSGTGASAVIPPEIKGWNWGGFLLTWIWGIGNNTWIALVALLGLIPYVGWIASLTMRIILGIYGNEWAWRNKKWDNIEHFKSTQRKWFWWGIAFFLLQFLLAVAIIILVFSLYMIADTSGIDYDFYQYYDSVL